MVEVRDFLEIKRGNDIIVQRALRDIDTEVLCSALLDMDEEEQGIIYRNMSKRAHALILEEKAEKEGRTSPHDIRNAKAFFLQLLRRYAKYGEDGITFPQEEDIPDINTSTDAAIIDTFYNLCRYLRRFGALSLEKVEEKASHPLMGKGLELIIDGWDPLLVRSVLEQYRESYVADVERKTQMILDGVDSMMDGDVPEVTREKLTAYMQKS